MKTLLKMLILSAPVQLILREVAEIIITELSRAINNSTALLGAHIRKRLENGSKKDVQLHNQNLSSKESKIKNSGLRLVSNRECI